MAAFGFAFRSKIGNCRCCGTAAAAAAGGGFMQVRPNSPSSSWIDGSEKVGRRRCRHEGGKGKFSRRREEGDSAAVYDVRGCWQHIFKSGVIGFYTCYMSSSSPFSIKSQRRLLPLLLPTVRTNFMNKKVLLLCRNRGCLLLGDANSG